MEARANEGDVVPEEASHEHRAIKPFHGSERAWRAGVQIAEAARAEVCAAPAVFLETTALTAAHDARCARVHPPPVSVSLHGSAVYQESSSCNSGSGGM